MRILTLVLDRRPGSRCILDPRTIRFQSLVSLLEHFGSASVPPHCTYKIRKYGTTSLHRWSRAGIWLYFTKGMRVRVRP
jgi:hypothetical protein